MNVFLRKFGWVLLLSVSLLCSTNAARADDALVIRGDQSIPLLSDVPVPVESNHEIFMVKPRLTTKEELVLLLGNVELFVTPPQTIPTDVSESLNSDSKVDSKNTNKDSAGDAQ
ncbi:MAG: hypothetical protein RI953_2134 [Pseudomonadota bacterium]|jgi:hypothetical protein